jgi:AAA15 family ATPase/GTPase
VIDLEILTEHDTPILHLVFEDHSVPVAFAGDGLYALVQLSLELASRPQGVVLLEEPEVHEHPAAIRQAVRAILAAVRRDIQVILTTHSLELIDALLAESSEADLERLSLYRLELDNGRLISVRKPGPDIAFARGEIEEDLR